MDIQKQIEVGDIVYLRPVGNNDRYGNTAIRTATISKVGRKYFEVSDGRYVIAKFCLEDKRQENGGYSATWALYLSEQEIADENEYLKKLKDIREKFGGWGKCELSLSQIRQIWSITQGEDKTT